jgi:hypothetical protein
VEKQADQLAALETKFEELEEELKASRGDVDSNTAAVEKLQQVIHVQHQRIIRHYFFEVSLYIVHILGAPLSSVKMHIYLNVHPIFSVFILINDALRMVPSRRDFPTQHIG